MERHGVVLKKLRAIRGLQIRQAADLIKRSPGWLSEIENERGEARIYPAEFERIVAAYEGEKYRKQFSIWIANANIRSPARETKKVYCWHPRILRNSEIWRRQDSGYPPAKLGKGWNALRKLPLHPQVSGPL